MDYLTAKERIRKEMRINALKKGWRKVKGDNIIFRKGKGEVEMNLGEGVIFGTVGGTSFDKKGRYYSKHYPQNKSLSLGKYNESRIKRYSKAGENIINQIDAILKNKIKKVL